MQSGRKPPARSKPRLVSLPTEEVGRGSEVGALGAGAGRFRERRSGDRRQRPTRPWADLFGPLRRARGRRKSDHGGYVDRYSGREVGLLLTIFALNVADAFFTMRWLQRGGREANPIMDFFLDIGPYAFLLQKCVVVGLWLVILLVHKNFRFARLGLYSAFVVYGALLILHFGIVLLGIEPVPADGPEYQTRGIAEPVTASRFDPPATE